MKKNVGTTDKIARISVALLIAILYFTNVINGTLAVVLLVLAAVFIITAFVGICPLYLPFGVRTTKK